MYTLKSVLDALGSKAQVTGGKIIVHHAGKNVEVGRVMSENGTFNMTPAGHALLEELAAVAPVIEEAPAKPKKETAAEKKAREKAEAEALAAAEAAKDALPVVDAEPLFEDE